MALLLKDLPDQLSKLETDAKKKMFDLMETQYAILYGEDMEETRNMIMQHITDTLKSADPFIIENFGDDMEWINTSKPLSLENSFNNRILVIDFFTYCCINCIHIMPYLKYIEEKYPVSDGVAIIGIHSAKFTNERILNNVKDAVVKYDITHPVANDPGCALWNKLDITCWPTIVVIGPQGHVLFSLVGEHTIKKLDFLLGEIQLYFAMKNTCLEKSPLPMQLLKETIPTCRLFYPSSVCVNDKSNTLFIADTGHHRILIVTNTGYILDIVGNGAQGYENGAFASSSFDSPRGLAWRHPHFVYVADTGNHCIRLINCLEKTVITVVSGLENVLNATKEDIMEHSKDFLSPWDVCLGPDMPLNHGAEYTFYQIDIHFVAQDHAMPDLNCLYIAVAGSHQIWVLYLEDIPNMSGKGMKHKAGTCEIFAGIGKEESRNNTYKLKAGFAQPSGVSFSHHNEEFLFVADSESSSIRSISLLKGAVKTVVGGSLDPLDLFQFGDTDGMSKDVKLQHPIGVCVYDKTTIFVSDSYNNKIKIVNPVSCTARSFAGSGICGNEVTGDVKENLSGVEFNEPSGLCLSKDGKKLFVADTNNHCIKVIELEEEKVSILNIQNKSAIVPAKSFGPIVIISRVNTKRSLLLERGSVIEATKMKMQVSGEIKCTFSVDSESKVNITEGAPQPWKISIKGRNMSVCCQSGLIFDQNIQPSLLIKDDILGSENTVSQVSLETSLCFCEKKDNTCFSSKVMFKFDVEFCDEGDKNIHVNLVCLVK